MKTVSEGFKTEAKSYARNELVKFIEKGTNNVIDGEYIVDGFLQEISYADGTLVGNTPAKNLEVNILNPNSVEYMGKEIEVYTGLTVNGQQEFVKHGTFIIDSSEEDVAKGTVKVTALDYMIKFNKTFVDELDWSVTRTLRDFAEYVCEKCNMTLSSKAFPNDSYVLTEQPAFEGYSCRYVLGKIAEIAGSIAIINENDEAEIKPLTISNEYEDILVDSIMAMEVSETAYLPYNAVMISLAEGVEGENVTQRDEVSIEAYGERCLKIANNEFAINETVRQNLIEAIFSSINGFFYIPMSITYNSYDWLARLDKIHVYYDDEHYYETYLLNHTIEFPSSISSTIACESKSTTNTSFEYVPVAEQKQAHTEIVVDKLNKKITSTIEEVNSQSEKITQVTQNLESVNLSISNVEKGVASLETNLATTNKNLASTNQTVTDLEGDVDALSADLNGVSQDFADFKDNEYVQSIENLQNQIDGAIQFWNGADIPTLNNYPANEWTTEADKNNHRADIYTVIQDVDGELKQGKAYRFDKVDGIWQWIELTDNELSAVQEIAQNALKQANTNATDITTLKQTDTEIKASIEGIQLNYNTLNNQFDSTVITSKTVEGNPTHITDAGDYDLDRLYLEGNSYQKTTSGVNKLNLKELVSKSYQTSISNLTSNSVDISTTTSTTYISSSFLLDLPVGSYKLSCQATWEDDTYTATTQAICNVGVYEKGTTTRVKYFEFKWEKQNKGNRRSVNFTVEDNELYDYKIVFYPVSSLGLQGRTVSFYNVMVHEGTTLLDYEPYTNGPTPNPDYPQEIEVIEGSVDVEVVGKNLFDVKDVKNVASSYELLEDDWIKFTYDNSSGTATTWQNYYTSPSELLKPNTKYNVFVEIKEVSGNFNFYAVSVNSANNSQFKSNFAMEFADMKNNKTYNKVIETNNYTNNMFMLRTFVECGAGESGSITFRISVLEDTSITAEEFEYEPYKKTTTSLDLQDEFVGKCTTLDTLDVVTGKLNKNVGRVQLNGLENVDIETNTSLGYTRFKTRVVNGRGTDVQNRYPIKSTHFKNIASGGHAVGGAFVYQSVIYMYLPTDITTIAEAKAWLAENQPIFYYDLAEPYEVQLDSTSIELNKGVNNIYVKTNIGPSFISLTYLTDSVLNSQYATKTQLQLTKDSITSVVKDTTTLNANLTDLQALVGTETTNLKNALGDLTNDLEENYATNDSVLTVSNSVTNIQTSLNQQIEITKDIQVNGVSKVKTTTGFTFDEDGLTIEKTNADTKTNIDEDGMVVYSTTGSENTEMLVVDSQGVEAENVTVRTFLVVGSNSRFQDYETGTGCFYVGE